MLKKRGFLLLCVLLLLPALAVWGAGEVENDEATTISMGLWGNEAELALKMEHAEKAGEVYPGLTIEIQRYSDSVAFWDKLPAEIAANTAPDFLTLTNEGAFEYIKNELFTPLDSYIKEAGLDVSDYQESALAVWTSKDQLFGFPIGGAPAMFIINKDMWDEAGLKEFPETWEDVRIAAKKLTTEDRKGLIANIHEYHLTNYMLSFGGGWNNGKTIDSPQNIQALDFFLNLYDEGIAVSPKEAGYGWDGEAFAKGAGAMSTGGWWYKGFLSTAAPDMNLVFLPIPEGTTKGCTLHSSANVVLENTKNKLMATKAAYYMTDNALQSKLMEVTGLDPQKKSLSGDYYKINPEFKAIQAIIPYAQDFSYPVETKRFYDVLVKAIEGRVFGLNQKSASEILKEVQAQFN
jgi:multiple sugar transport system substrate-binding protein